MNLKGDRRGAVLLATVTAACCLHPVAVAAPADGVKDADEWAKQTEARMTDDERLALLSGVMPIPLPIPIPGKAPFRIPAGAPITAGWVGGIERLGVPPQISTDASLGVVNPLQLRPDDRSTAMPSGLLLASSFDPGLAERVGATVGSEARAKGFNILLGGGVNLARDPRNGRNFEYLGEDPLLAGRMVGAAIRGTQSQGVVSTIKHYALNGQETLRMTADSVIDEDAARESDLLAFQFGIEIGQPGAVMCAYNLVNGTKACGNDWLLNRVLKKDWAYKGWVMSDWGATGSAEFFDHGLDQQCGSQLDDEVWFGEPLRMRVQNGQVPRARLSDAVRRILRSMRAVGIERRYEPSPIDFAAHSRVALDAARGGIVLLKNEGALPLATDKKVLVVGGMADFGVLSGAGSSQVTPSNGPPRLLPVGGDGLMANWNKMLFMPSSPVLALRSALGEKAVRFDTGYSDGVAVAAAKQADVVIVFATKWEAEGADSGSLELPQGQDQLIRRISAANPNTIVVLETGNPVLMPWLDSVRAVVQAWYPGQEGGQAIAEVLTGAVNPSGRLPMTFPATLDGEPRERLPGIGMPERTQVEVHYSEGADVGYRRYDKTTRKPLFPFGFGLSYTTFEHSELVPKNSNRAYSPLEFSFTVRNTGARAGADVPQIYLVGRSAEKVKRLVGFQRVQLEPGESREIHIALDDRLLGDFRNGEWKILAGRYRFVLASSAGDEGKAVEVSLSKRSRRP